MKLTTKGRYAVTAMLDLAVHDGEGPITLADISGRQGISLSYLEQLFAKLRKTGLVASTRGPGGGYKLSRHPSEIAIDEIIVAVDEPVDATGCGGLGDCCGDKHCLTHNLWEELSQQIRLFLSGVSLADVIQRYHLRESSSGNKNKTVELSAESGVVETSFLSE